MQTKHKVAMVVTIAVMALAIIGLTIGLVLTAANLSVTNSMTVTYSVTDVKASIVASGEIHEAGVKKTEGGDIAVTGGNTDANDGSVVIDTTLADGTQVSGAAFGTVALTDDGHAVYVFAITNDGSVNNMKVDVNVINTATVEEGGANKTLADANIKMGIASSIVAEGNDATAAKAAAIANATKTDASATLATVTVSAQGTVYVAIAFSVIDTGAAASLTAHASIALTDAPVIS